MDWYPWGEEAFAKARAEDKPIFLSGTVSITNIIRPCLAFLLAHLSAAEKFALYVASCLVLTFCWHLCTTHSLDYVELNSLSFSINLSLNFTQKFSRVTTADTFCATDWYTDNSSYLFVSMILGWCVIEVGYSTCHWYGTSHSLLILFCFSITRMLRNWVAL